jgi:hypothetical protein
MKSKEFSLGQVLSVTTERLLCNMGGLYKILNFITDDDLFTHQLPRANESAKPWVLEQYPQLAAINASTVTSENYREFLAAQEAIFGASLQIFPLPKTEWEKKDALAELVEMVGPEKVIVVASPTD